MTGLTGSTIAPYFRMLRAVVGKLIPESFKRQLSSLIPEKTEDWMCLPLSPLRPFEHCNLPLGDVRAPFLSHLVEAEWRLLAWFEENEIAYDISTCRALNDNETLLGPYKAVVLNSHSEYWSQRMYSSLMHAHRNIGLWVINASGNSIYRPIEYLSNGAIRYLGGKFKNVVSDEGELLGNRFTSRDMGTAAPYEVMVKDHWVFEGLGVVDGDLIGTSCLNSAVGYSGSFDPRLVAGNRGLAGVGGSGWETDKQIDSRNSTFIRVAHGRNTNGGADMLVRDSSGARGGVFSAGSITFTGSLLVDQGISRILKNVLDKALL